MLLRLTPSLVVTLPLLLSLLGSYVVRAAISAVFMILRLKRRPRTFRLGVWVRSTRLRLLMKWGIGRLFNIRRWRRMVTRLLSNRRVIGKWVKSRLDILNRVPFLVRSPVSAVLATRGFMLMAR